MTRVFPDPAPARIITGPSVCRTASRCSGLSFSRKVIGGTDFQYNAEAGGRRSEVGGRGARVVAATLLELDTPSNTAEAGGRRSEVGVLGLLRRHCSNSTRLPIPLALPAHRNRGQYSGPADNGCNSVNVARC